VAAPKKSALPYLRWLLLLSLPLLWCVADHYGQLDFLENKTVDWRFRHRGEIAAPVKIVYADVDSVSLDELGNVPWNRERFAKVSAALIGAGRAKAVGIDYVFSEKGISEVVDKERWVKGNVQLKQFLDRKPAVVVAASYASAVFSDNNGLIQSRDLPLLYKGLKPLDQIEPPEEPQFNMGRGRLESPPTPIGLIDTIDGGTRWVPAFAPSVVATYRHMALELALLWWGLTPDAVKTYPDRMEFVAPDGRLVAKIPLTKSQLIEINWFSPWQSDQCNPRVSFSTVYNYATMLASDQGEKRTAAQTFFAQFNGAVVLIGPVDPLLQDLAPTPMDDQPAPRVGVHGNLLKTIVSGKYLYRLPPWVGWTLVLGLTLLAATFAVAGGARSVLYKIAAVAVVALYVLAAFELFRRYHWVLPLTAPLGAMFTTSFTAVVWQVWEEQKQKGRIKGMFGTYLSPTVVHNLIESGKDPELGGHDAEITAYFSDIQEFSSFSEVLPASKLGELLNEYLSACTDIVQAEGGTLDKFIGDAVVAMYGAPVECADHAYRACVASQLVQRQIAELREKWRSEGDKWPQRVHHLQTRIGLNTGVCMIGNMGSRTRFNYTMMGDNVNLAARMESGAKSWGVYSMVAEATKLACEQHGGDRVVFRPLGRIVVKGRSQAVPIFEIVGLKEFVTAEARECTGLFAQGLASYYARDWEAAIARFQQSVKLEPNQPGQTPGVKSNPSLVYLDITAHYRAEPPPENWDGVYVMKEK
jgi:adenylate cyclase